ncbi:MAG TPA: biotin/lipoyl-binding protein, partial [Myxococcales bacterium]
MRDRRLYLFAGAAVLIAAIAFFVYQRTKGQAAAAARNEQQAAQRPVPVVSAQVQKKDVPIYLDGIGNVIAFKTVTVRSQVDGLLDAVLFREGQAVRRGDLIARIDPRPFLNQLHQAEGALGRDKAQLEGARLNLHVTRTWRRKSSSPSSRPTIRP